MDVGRDLMINEEVGSAWSGCTSSLMRHDLLKVWARVHSHGEVVKLPVHAQVVRALPTVNRITAGDCFAPVKTISSLP